MAVGQSLKSIGQPLDRMYRRRTRVARAPGRSRLKPLLDGWRWFAAKKVADILDLILGTPDTRSVALSLKGLVLEARLGTIYP